MPTRAPAAEALRSRRFLLGSLAALAAVSFLILVPFLSGIVFALAAGFVLQRPFRALARWVRWRPLAAGLMVLLVVVALFLPLAFVAWQLVGEAQGIVQQAGHGGYNETFRSGLASLGVPDATAAKLAGQGAAGAAGLLQQFALGALGKLPRALANVGIFLLVLFFILLSGEGLGEWVRRSIPLPPARRDRLLATVAKRVRALFLGTFLVALVQGSVATLGWWLLGFPNPLFWGFVMTLLAVIPGIGPMLVLAPAALIALLTGRPLAGAILLAYGIAVVGVVDNVVRSLVVGRGSSVHPALILLGTLGGLLVFGLTGFILGPLVLSMVAPVLEELNGSAEAPAEAA